MMQAKQYTKDWNKRYLEGNTPWEDEVPSPEMQQAILHFAPSPATIIEIGCGLGSNARWLASHKYSYHGLDISPEAVRRAREMMREKRLNASFEVGDVLEYEPMEHYDIVLDKGCLHTFLREKERIQFVEKVAALLNPDGFWFCVAGSADHPDPSGGAKRYGHPRLSAADLVRIAEPAFEIHYIARCLYGVTPEVTDFLGWCCVFQRRAKRVFARAA